MGVSGYDCKIYYQEEYYGKRSVKKYLQGI